MALSVENFKPLNDKILVLIPKLENKTKAGIMKSEKMMEEELKDIPQVFEVKAVGSKVEGISVGNYVLCTRVNQVPFKADVEGFVPAIVAAFDVIGVFPDKYSLKTIEDEK